MKINVHIDRLVLEGLDITSDRSPLLQRAVETELTRLLTGGGLAPSLAQGVALPRIAAGNIEFNDGNNPAPLGQQIAQSVYGGISRE